MRRRSNPPDTDLRDKLIALGKKLDKRLRMLAEGDLGADAIEAQQDVYVISSLINSAQRLLAEGFSFAEKMSLIANTFDAGLKGLGKKAYYFAFEAYEEWFIGYDGTIILERFMENLPSITPKNVVHELARQARDIIRELKAVYHIALVTNKMKKKKVSPYLDAVFAWRHGTDIDTDKHVLHRNLTRFHQMVTNGEITGPDADLTSDAHKYDTGRGVAILSPYHMNELVVENEGNEVIGVEILRVKAKDDKTLVLFQLNNWSQLGPVTENGAWCVENEGTAASYGYPFYFVGRLIKKPGPETFKRVCLIHPVYGEVKGPQNNCMNWDVWDEITGSRIITEKIMKPVFGDVIFDPAVRYSELWWGFKDNWDGIANLGTAEDLLESLFKFCESYAFDLNQATEMTDQSVFEAATQTDPSLDEWNPKDYNGIGFWEAYQGTHGDDLEQEAQEVFFEREAQIRDDMIRYGEQSWLSEAGEFGLGFEYDKEWTEDNLVSSLGIAGLNIDRHNLKTSTPSIKKAYAALEMVTKAQEAGGMLPNHVEQLDIAAFVEPHCA